MTGRFNKPCLECGTLSKGNYCPQHGIRNGSRSKAKAQAYEQKPDRVAKKRLLYGPEYRKIAKQFKQTEQICHICKTPIPQGVATADHLTPGDPASRLLPAHPKCNSSRGNRPL